MRRAWALVAAVWGIAIFVGSVIPAGPTVSADGLDKALHLGVYALFAWLLTRALPPTWLVGGQAVHAGRLRERDDLLLAWLYATGYGVLIELIQGLLPWRSADWADAAADALGAAIGVWLGQRRPIKPL